MLRKSLMSPIINPAQLVIGYAHMPHNDLHFYRIKVRLITLEAGPITSKTINDEVTVSVYIYIYIL